MLSLLHNEVVNKQYYRLYTINLVPSLKQLDFQKVTVKASGGVCSVTHPSKAAAEQSSSRAEQQQSRGVIGFVVVFVNLPTLSNFFCRLCHCKRFKYFYDLFCSC